MKLKVGMRVKCNHPVGTKRYIHEIGTILATPSFNGGDVAVEFDRCIDGHDCSGRGLHGRYGYCWNVPLESLEPVETTPEEAFNQLIYGYIDEETYKKVVGKHGS